jgi:hypothetical protein
VELAKRAHARFVYASSSRGPKRMYWKMSIAFLLQLLQGSIF